MPSLSLPFIKKAPASQNEPKPAKEPSALRKGLKKLDAALERTGNGVARFVEHPVQETQRGAKAVVKGAQHAAAAVSRTVDPREQKSEATPIAPAGPTSQPSPANPAVVPPMFDGKIGALPSTSLFPGVGRGSEISAKLDQSLAPAPTAQAPEVVAPSMPEMR